MQLTEQHIIKDDRFKEWCVKSKNLYNLALYYWRQSVFGNIQYFSEFELLGLFREFKEESYMELPSHCGQEVIRNLFKNIKGWQRSQKEYAKNPSKFLSKPQFPKYKKELSILSFNNYQVRLKKGYVHFPKKIGIEPMKTNITSIDCCRVIPKSNHFVVEFIYTVEEKPLQEYNGNWMGVDIGLNNLATCVTSNGKAFIINGKPLKAVNNFYNKRKKQLQSKLKRGVYTSKRIERLIFRRNQKIKDYIHKASKQIVTIAKENNITKIIIGKNEKWKQNINIGKKNNREFTSIPHSTLIEKTAYKALFEGMEVIEQQEAYTSKCSALDLEPICKHEKYMGKRKKRGLFVTATGKLINADANGALNITRLWLNVSGNEFKLSEPVMSCVVQPKRINILSI